MCLENKLLFLVFDIILVTLKDNFGDISVESNLFWRSYGVKSSKKYQRFQKTLLKHVRGILDTNNNHFLFDFILGILLQY